MSTMIMITIITYTITILPIGGAGAPEPCTALSTVGPLRSTSTFVDPRKGNHEPNTDTIYTHSDIHALTSLPTPQSQVWLIWLIAIWGPAIGCAPPLPSLPEA